jgi:hypothetical protein
MHHRKTLRETLIMRAAGVLAIACCTAVLAHGPAKAVVSRGPAEAGHYGSGRDGSAEPGHDATGPTFSEDVAPILYANCVTCHRPGEAAPFSLISYEDVAKRASLIAKVTQSHYMPPWHAEHGYGDFVDERRLTDEQIGVIGEWVKGGMPRGDASKLPPLPRFADGWQLGTPDLALEMPDGFEVPASGPDIYRNFPIPSGLTEDKWVRAVEFRPSARRVVHHALFGFVRGGATAALDRTDGKPGFAGLAPVAWFPGFAPAGELGGWAVGATARFMPEGLALPMAKGSDFVLQLHFHPTGKPETERSKVGIYFAPGAPERKVWAPGLPGLFGLLADIDIPAGEKDYAITGSLTLPVDMRAYAVSAHAHYLGKEITATATLPDGTTQPLLRIKDWDFNWQDVYTYKTPVLLPKDTRIDVRITYDNSADNPHNPSNPPKRVQWGEESTDEMGAVRILMTTARMEDEAVLQERLAAGIKASLAQAAKSGVFQRYQERRRQKRAGGDDEP